MGRKHSERPQISDPNRLRFGNRGPDRPDGHYSFFALVLVFLAASVVLGIAHNFWVEAINSNFAGRVRSDFWTFRDYPMAEWIPALAWSVGLGLAIACALVVHLLPAAWGRRVVYSLACLAAVGLVLAWRLPIEPLTVRTVSRLEVQQIWAHVLAALCVTLPLGAAVGWCARLAKW
jgi:hypothetical protein